MVRCIECGFEAERLQWTHFKFNCNGKFKNGKEYKAAHPGAKVVSDSLTKITAVTQDNLIRKYGEEEGKARWNDYRQKQAYTNSFEHKEKKHGWSQDQFNSYNSSRAQTLEKMIARFGEEVGAANWEAYCLRQAYTNTKSYFIEKYGHKTGTARYLEINAKKSIPNNPLLLATHLNISEEEATQIIMSRKSSHHCSNLENEFALLLESELGFSLDHTSLNSPFGKWSDLLNSYVVYDIVHKNCIIEFNGDYWHANPKIYAETATIRGKAAIDIWNRDMLKLKTATDSGFKILTIWEQEFKGNKAETIKRAAEWMLLELK